MKLNVFKNKSLFLYFTFVSRPCIILWTNCHFYNMRFMVLFPKSILVILPFLVSIKKQSFNFKWLQILLIFQSLQRNRLLSHLFHSLIFSHIWVTVIINLFLMIQTCGTKSCASYVNWRMKKSEITQKI